MSAGPRIFFDTTPLIYLLESNPDFGAQVSEFFTQAVDERAVFLSSILLYTEYCIVPERAGRPDLIRNFDRFLARFEFKLFDVT